MSQPFSATVRLDDESLNLVNSLIGVIPYRILAPCLQVAARHLTAPSLSFELGRRDYLDFTCTWFELRMRQPTTGGYLSAEAKTQRV